MNLEFILAASARGRACGECFEFQAGEAVFLKLEA
jgi:hypothetical protein